MQRAINDLLQARGKAIKELQALAAKSAGSPLDATEQGTYANLKAGIADIDAKIKDLQELSKNEPAYEPAQAVTKEEKPLANYIRYGETEGLSQGGMDAVSAARMMGITLRGQDRTGFAPVVPVEYENEVQKLAKEASLVLRLCKNIPVGSSSKEIPIGKDDTVAYWRAEKGEHTDSASDLDKKTLKPYSLYSMTKITRELIEDASIDVEAYTKENQAAVMGLKIDSAFFGNDALVAGTSPKGFFDDMTPQALAGATLAYADIAKLYMGLKQKYRDKGTFVGTNAFITSVMTLTDDSGRPIYMPSYESGKPDRLFGKPIYEAETFGNVTISAANKAAQCAFADWNYIGVGLRRGMTVLRLAELYAANGQIGILTDARLDACVILKEATRLLYTK